MAKVSLDMWRVSPESKGPGDSFDSAFRRHWDDHEVVENRCSHFSLTVGVLSVPGVAPPMQVPIYRCSIAEEMVARLKTTPEGQWLAERLEAPPLNGIPRLISGPDLEAISTTSCIPERCHRSCRAGFVQILTELGLDATPPEE
jgi:hypothetical protein